MASMTKNNFDIGVVEFLFVFSRGESVLLSWSF